MSEYKFSAARSKLGLDTGYFAHPRSRWSGCPYWLVANPAAVPERVRSKTKQSSFTPHKIAGFVREASEAVREGRAFRVYVGIAAKPYYETWARSVHVDRGLLCNSVLSLAVNAYFFDWAQRHIEPGGEWWLTLNTNRLLYVRGKTPHAMVMPIRLGREDTLRLGGVVAEERD